MASSRCNKDTLASFSLSGGTKRIKLRIERNWLALINGQAPLRKVRFSPA